MNSLVIQWVCDQTTGIIEFLTALFCFILIVRNLRQHNDGNFHCNFPKSFKTAIYCVYISTMFHGSFILLSSAALPMTAAIYPPSRGYQSEICLTVSLCLFPTFVIQQVAIINVFVIRLDIAFQGTLFKLSKCVKYTFLVGYPVVVIILNVITLMVVRMQSVPYNIYKGEIALNGNGVTCSPFADSKPNPLLSVCVGLIGIGIVGGNLCVWILFIKRLYHLVKLQSDAGKIKDDAFIQFMKEQTFIACVAVTSTFLAWSFNAFLSLGAIMIGIDISLTCFVIFLSFAFNRKYYLMLKCDKVTNVCCGTCFDRIIGDTEKEMIDVVTQKTQSPPADSETHTVNRCPSTASGNVGIQIH